MISAANIAKGLTLLVERDGNDPTVVADAFVSYATEYGLLLQVPRVLEVLVHNSAEAAKRGTLTIESQQSIGSDLTEQIRARIGAPADAPVASVENRDLHAGVRAMYGDRYLDASAESIISNIEHAIING